MGRTVVLLVLLAVGAFAGPIGQTLSSDRCSRTCTASNKFHYTAGKTYEFQYDSETRISSQGASEDHSSLRMSATVHIDAMSRCELVMRLSDVTLTEYDPTDGIMKPTSDEFKTALEANPIRVSFQDGNVEELCLTGHEPVWVVNVKRGILSVFQNNIDNFETSQNITEVDVMGVCDTKYTAGEKGWYSTAIKKSKNLLGCRDRTSYNTGMQSIPYKADSEFQELPLLKSTLECEHNVDQNAGRLTTATCWEKHVLRPFSREDSGPTTLNTQKLTFLRETTASVNAGNIIKRVPLKFEHAHAASKQTIVKRELEQKLMSICENTKSGVQSETPRLFMDLVYIIRSTDADDLIDLYRKVKNGEICSDNKQRVGKFILDALPLAGTSSSLRLMVQLLQDNEVTGSEASMWMTSLTFVKNPTRGMLTEIKPLLANPALEEKVLLAAGSLIHSFCRTVNTCETDPVVRSIITAIGDKIGSTCSVTKNNMKIVLLSLRAVGNAGFGRSIIDTLNNCMTTRNPVEIRLSAIDAFRRMSCDSDKHYIMSIFENPSEDSEIRIAAYKALMECPSALLLNKVKGVVDLEDSQQLGSFVWSHLSNLMETSDPHKQEFKAILNTMHFGEVDKEKTKFSRNYEKSLFLEKLNTGAKAEADVIWSSKSFIPRSGMVNLTVNMFGNSVNLFELGGRAEGLEYFMESMLGPNGYFSDNVPATPSERALSGFSKLGRINRRFGKDLDELKGSFYMRVFGNEMRYMNFQGIDSLTSGQNFNVLEMLIQLARNNDYTFTQSYMFLDSSIVIPTGSGFPMNLTLNGSVTVDLKASGRMDLRSPPNLDINGLLQPSAAVDISSMISVDAYVTKSGIKMASSLYTNTAVQGHIRFNEAGILTAEYEMPQQKMDIISVKSSFFIVHRDMEKKQQMITENRQTRSLCTPSQFTTITGLELCGEVQYPNASSVINAPYFPLTGPVTAGLYLYKKDTHMKYKFDIRSTHNLNSNVLHVSFNTPDSTIDRHMELDFNLDKRTKSLDMTMQSPWKSAKFLGTVTRERNIAGLSGKMSVDGNSIFFLNTQITRGREGNAYKYTPLFELNVPGRQPINLQATITNNNLRQVDVEFSVSGITELPVKGKGTLYNKPFVQGVTGELNTAPGSPYSFDIRLSKQLRKKSVNYTPLISIRTPEAEVLAFGGTVAYMYDQRITVNVVLDKITAKRTILKGSISKRDMKNRRSIYKSKLTFQSSPMDLTWDVSFDNRNWKTVATAIDFTYVIRRVHRNNFKITSKIMNLSSSTLTNWRTMMELQVKRNPEWNMKVTGNMNHNVKHSELNVDLRYGHEYKDENNHLEIATEMNRNFDALTAASADVTGRIQHAGQGIAILVKGSHMHTPTELDSNLQLRFGKQTTIASNLRLRDKTQQDLVRLTADFELEYPGRAIKINQTLDQPRTGELLTTTNVQPQTGELNTLSTSWRSTGPNGLQMLSSLNLHEQTPIRVDGEWNIEPENFVAKTSVTRNQDTLSGAITSLTVPGVSTQMAVDVYYPTRRILLDFAGRKENNCIFTDTELRWNADVDNSQRVTFNTVTDLPESNNVNGSFTLTYPSRTLKLNVQHRVTAKYISHLDVSWEPTKVIVIDSIFENTLKTNGRMIIGEMKLVSPFKGMRKVNLDFQHTENSEEYNTNINANWSPSKTVTSTIVLKKPISLTSLVGSISGRTTFPSLKKYKFELDHKLGNALSSTGKVSWNRHTVQVEISAANKSRPLLTNLEGGIDIKTTFSYFKKMSLLLTHSNDGRTISNDAHFIRNKKQYIISSKITHQLHDYNLENSGKLTVTSPSEELVTTWNHRNTLSDLSSTVTSTWGKKSISVKLNGHHDITMETASVSGSFEVQTPFTTLRDFLLHLNHEQRISSLDSSFQVVLDGSSIAKAEAVYNDDRISHRTGKIIFLINPLEVDVALQGDGTYSINSANDHIELSFKPRERITLDLNWKRPSDETTETEIIFTSPYSGFERTSLTKTYTVKTTEVAASCVMEYKAGKSIAAEYRAVTTPSKLVFISLSTPFEPLRNLQSEIKVTSDSQSLTTEFYVHALPQFERISATALLNTANGITSQVRVDTPFNQFPYFQASANSHLNGNSRESLVLVEFLPRQQVRMESTYNLRDMTQAALSMKLTTPFEELPYSAIDFSHTGDQSQFKTHIECEYNSGRKVSTDITFSNIDNTEGSVIISSPFTDDVTGSFSYVGDMSNFQWRSDLVSGLTKRFITDLDYRKETSVPTASGSVTWRLFSQGGVASFQHRGSFEMFDSHVEYSPQNVRTTEIDLKFDSTDNLSGSLSLRSPYTGNIGSTFRHQQKLSSPLYINSYMEATMDSDIVFQGSASLNTESAVTGEINIKNPFTHDLRFLGRFSGTASNFDAHSEINIGNKTAEMDITSQLGSAWKEISTTMKLPGYPDTTATFSHNGQLDAFKNDASLTIFGEKHTISGAFRNYPNIDGQLEITSSRFEHTILKFNHFGSYRNFRCHADLTIGGDVSTVDANFGITPSITGGLTVSSPMFPSVVAQAEYAGEFPEIAANAELSYSNNKQLDFDLTLTARDKIMGQISLTTPFQTTMGMISHEGNLEKLLCHAEVTHDGQKTETDISFNSVGRYDGQVTLKSDYFPEMMAGFTHTGNLAGFTCHAEGRMGVSSTSADITLSSTDSVLFTARLRNPLVEDISVSYKHTGELSNFKCEADIIYGYETHTGDITFNMTDGIVGRINVLMAGYAPMHMYLTHKGDAFSSISTNVEMEYEREIHDFSIRTIAGETALEGDLSLRSPLIDNIEITVRHSGGPSNYKTTGAFTQGINRYSVDTTLNSNDEINAEVVISSPVAGYENIRTGLMYRGKPTDFQSEASLSLPGSQNTGSVRLNIDTAFEGAASITSPLIPQTLFTFSKEETNGKVMSKAELVVDREIIFGFDSNHQITTAGLQSHAEIQFYGERSEADATFLVDPTTKVEGLLNLRTAYFPQFTTDLTVDITPEGKLNGRSKLEYDTEKKVGLQFALEYIEQIEASLDLTTVFENFTTALGRLKLNRDELMSQLQVERENIFHAKATLENNERTGLDFSLMSAYLTPVEGHFYIQGNSLNMQSNSALSYGGKKITNHVQFTLSNEPFQSTGSITFITPSLREMGVSYRFAGHPSNFNGHIDGRMDGEKMAANMNFNFEQDLTFSCDLSHPQYRSLKTSFSNRLSRYRLNTIATLEIQEDKYEIDSLVNWRRGIDTTFTMTTPFENYERSQVLFNLDGEFPNIRSAATITNSGKTLKVVTHFNAYRNGEITITTPFSGYENIGASFYREGNWEKCTAGGKVTYATGSDVELSFEHDWSPMSCQAKLQFMSPFTDEITVSLNNTGTLSGFSSNFEASVSRDFKTVSTTSLRTGPNYIGFESAITTTVAGESRVQRAIFDHDGSLERFRTSASLSYDAHVILMETNFHTSPNIEGSMTIQTPFKSFTDIKAVLSHSGRPNQYTTTGEFQLNPDYKYAGKLDIENRGWNSFLTSVEMSTPMDGLRFSKASYRHTGDSNRLECISEVHYGEDKITGTLLASKTPMNFELAFTTPSDEYRELGIKGNVIDARGRITSRLEAYLNEENIVLDGSFVSRSQNRIMNGRISLNTPFQQVRSIIVEANHKQTGDKFRELFKTTLNNEGLVDFEIDHSLMAPRKSASITIRSPKPMKMETEFEIVGSHSDVDIVANWNTERSDSNIRVEAGYDTRSSNTASFKVVRPQQIITFSGNLEMSSALRSKVDLSWGLGSTEKVGYDIAVDGNEAQAKLILPSRSVKVSGSNRQRVTEGYLMWDADVDNTKKVGFRSVIVPSEDSIVADVTFMMPSIGKNVQVGSQMTVNRGRVIFDGKTELSYSTDVSKKITIVSRLEDISNADSKNYSFSVGVTHPYTTVGIQLASHLAKSSDKYTCGIGLEYMTIQRQTQTFNVNGEINRLRKTVSLELATPVKSIAISGSAQTDDKFQVSLLNVYDQKTPINTVLAVDPTLKSVEFKTNYDLDNPENEFHMYAKYVNSSAVAAEVFHVVNRAKVTDILLTSYLNNSHLLHSRMHWNTRMALDFEAYRSRKSGEYKERIRRSFLEIQEAVITEIGGKLLKIWGAAEEEIGSENVAKFEALILPILDRGMKSAVNVSGHVYEQYYQTLQNMASKYESRYQDFITNYMDPTIRSPIAALNINYRRPADINLDKVLNLIRVPARYIPPRVHGMLNSSLVRMLPAVLKQQIDNANKFWELEENLANRLEEVLLWLEREMETELIQLTHRLVESVNSPITVYDPRHGEIQAEFHLIFPVYSLDVAPAVDFSRYIMRAEQYIPKDISIPSLPTFEGYARLANFRTVTTFDGTVFDLPNRFNNLLLARDFLDGNFTIIAKKNPEAVLQIFVNDQAIEIRESGEVRVMGNLVTLPFSNMNVTITGSPQNILVSGAGSFTVKFTTTDGNSDIQLSINKFYFSRTGGIFGSFDNEPSNDLMTSYNRVIDDPNRFTWTWAV